MTLKLQIECNVCGTIERFDLRERGPSPIAMPHGWVLLVVEDVMLDVCPTCITKLIERVEGA